MRLAVSELIVRVRVSVVMLAAYSGSVLAFGVGAETVQFGVVLILCVGTFSLMLRRCGPFDIRTVMIGTTALYILSAAIDYFWFFNSAGFGVDTSSAVLVWGSLFFIMMAVVFVLGAEDASIGESRLDLDISGPRVSAGILISWFLVALYVLMSFANFNFDLQVGGLDRGQLTSGRWASAVLVRYLVVGLLISCAWAVSTARADRAHHIGLAVPISALVVFDLLFFGDRRIVLSLLIALAFIFANRSWRAVLAIPLAIVSGVTLLLYSALRNQPATEWLDLLGSIDYPSFLSPANLEFGGFPRIFSDVLLNGKPFQTGAPTYLAGVASVVPEAIYPNRPIAFSGWYVETFHPEVAAIGGGMAGNWVVESVINLGCAGPLLLGVSIAVLVNVLGSPRNPLSRLCIAAFIPPMAFLARMDMTSFLQLVLEISIPAVFFGWLLCRRSMSSTYSQNS